MDAAVGTSTPLALVLGQIPPPPKRKPVVAEPISIRSKLPTVLSDDDDGDDGGLSDLPGRRRRTGASASSSSYDASPTSPRTPLRGSSAPPFRVSRTGLRSAPPSMLSSSSSSSPSATRFASAPSRDAKSGNIRVVTRVRPINETERALGNDPCIVVEDSLVRVSSFRSSGVSSHHGADPHHPHLTQRTKEFPFFDSCVSADDNQDSAFEKFGVPELLDDALAGTNVTLFAYGQTGSGKTYTIHGIIPRSLQHLFERMSGDSLGAGLGGYGYGYDGCPPAYESTAPAAPAASDSIVCGASFCEIYNDSIYDLLFSSNRALKLKWDAGEGFHTPDIHIQPCNTLQDALAVLDLGNKRRRQRSHCLNAESSRSHAILTIYLFDRDDRDDTGDRDDRGDRHRATTKSTKIHFVDLAGSERLKESGNATAACPLAIKETANINKSLFLLGNVISAIAANQPRHLIPYRDTKLTKMLFGSMMHPSKCLMIACCSPSEGAVTESLGTLDYANRLASADAIPVVHVEDRDAMLIASLKRENRVLKEEIRILRGGG